MGNITFQNTSPNITFTIGYGTLGTGGHTIQDKDGVDYAQQPTLQFTGNATVADDDANQKTVVDIKGVETFLGLLDTPADYVGQAGNLVKVNNSEDGLTYGGASGVTVAWGDITGTLSNQTDLQGELDGKKDDFVENTGFNKNFGSAAGTVTQGNDSRLSDARTPLAHGNEAHTTNFEPAFSKNTAFNKNFGLVADTVTEGNDSRLSDARIPTPHAASHANGQADAISHTVLADIGSLTHLQIEASLNNKIEALFDDTTPKLGGDLDTLGQEILLGDGAGGFEGVIANLDTGSGAGFAYSDDGAYDPANGAVFVTPGTITFGGSIAVVQALQGTDNRDVQVAPDGTLFAAALPDPGWSHTDTDNGDYPLPTLTQWVEITGLVGIVQADVSAGDRLDIVANLHVIETGLRDGTIDVGFGVGVGVQPTTSLNFTVIAGFDGIIPVSFSTTTHGGLLTNDNISIWARRASESQASFAPEVHGSTDNIHELTISVPGSGSGGGGDATNLGNIPGPTTVTVTSSTGSNTVLAAASGAGASNIAGVMTAAQVDELNGKAAVADITYENLDANGDVGTGAGQLAIGNHNHAGVYEPADATILKEADVDDIPVDAATTDPISSNWAFDHINAADPHTQYLTSAEGDAAYEPIITPKNTAFNVNFGSGAGTACEGNDSRLSDARTPTAHAASHATGQADELTPVAIGAEPADATILKEADVDDIPVDAATTAPISSNWAYDHENASDPHPGYLTHAEGHDTYEPIITPKNTAFNVNFGSGAGTACEGNDARLSDSRTPTSHAASHANGSADEIDVASLGSGAATLNHVPLADGAGGVTWGNQSGGAPDLSNAEFPDYAVFDSEDAAGSGAIDFSSGNNQSVNATTYPAVTVTGPAGKVGHFLLKILNSASLSSINVLGGTAINWSGNTPPTWAGTTLLSLYSDGTEWYGSGLPDVRRT